MTKLIFIMNKKLILSIILGIIVTAIIFLSPISLSSMMKCFCGGCCVGCPGDCNAIGAPFALYYWGVNGISGGVVNQLSVFGLIADIIVWGILMFLIYRFIYKKKNGRSLNQKFYSEELTTIYRLRYVTPRSAKANFLRKKLWVV